MRNLRFIPTKVHGMMDYGFGAFMSGMAFLGPNKNKKKVKKRPAQRYVPLGLAIGATAYSLFTKYELGLIKKVPMKVHLGIDMASGLFLGLAPYVFKMDDRLKKAFVGLGAFEVMAGLLTKTETPKQHRFQFLLGS
ncbi:MAG: hypothetical protein ACK4ND_07160 [Cytophagaceae bacterium]